ncbi:MAG: hypothetical protein HXX13_10700 [Bacteroidetes bacterium]|nr:hypothetical protein [Bacteroidota bacterium]
MKNILSIILFALFLTFFLQAKAQTSPAHYAKGWGTELNFNPFNGSLSLNNASGQIKVRKFLSDKLALRAAIAIGYKSGNDKEKQSYGTSPYETTIKKNSLLTALNLGMEKHFNVGNRLSPYLGFELGFGLKKSKEEFGYNDTKKTIKGGWQTTSLIYNGQYYTSQVNYEERGFISQSGSILTGFDYYMDDHFYVGYEFGFGYEFIKYSKLQATVDENFPNNSALPDLDSKTWEIGPQLLNGIRIGYNF